jgi:hypothetical protein
MSALRRATPLVLLLLAGLVLFEEHLPGHEFVQRTFGHDAVIRLVVGVLCLYVLLLMAARQHMEASFRELVATLRRFREDKGGGPALPPQAQREALELLVAALSGAREDVRTSAREHLRRITGQDFGEDAGRWREWIERSGPKT